MLMIQYSGDYIKVKIKRLQNRTERLYNFIVITKFGHADSIVLSEEVVITYEEMNSPKSSN